MTMNRQHGPRLDLARRIFWLAVAAMNGYALVLAAGAVPSEPLWAWRSLGVAPLAETAWVLCVVAFLYMVQSLGKAFAGSR